ncbi:MAG: sugar transporter permease [Bacteriovoracaceae bacterium]|nr:sugar transporter permease [Bacteriovoracaceae bacterium]
MTEVKDKLKYFSQRFSEWKIFVVFISFFALAALFVPRFFDVQNLSSIVVQIAPVGVIAVGMTFVIITGGIDLSVGSLVAMISVLMAGPGNYPLVVMLLLALFWGLLAGTANGLMVSAGRLSAFIVTLSSMAIAKGIALWISNTEEKVIQDPLFHLIGSEKFFGLPLPLWIFLAIVIIGQIVLSRTVFGKRVFAVGSNPIAALNAGISVNHIRFFVYLISGFCAAISAVIISSRLNISTPTVGDFYELDAIAAVIIGGTSLFGGRGSVIGTLIGVLIFGIITNFLNLSGASPHMQRIAKGAVILIAVLMQSGEIFSLVKTYFRSLLTPLLSRGSQKGKIS